jgi:4,5-dihydroxyphthalate decarboxylase
MPKLSLTLACDDYDRVRAIRDGVVPIEGCDVNFLSLIPEETFFRHNQNDQFDVCEMSVSRYLMRRSRGTLPYIAIPAFVSRVFRHNAIYIRTDRGIKAPADLRGRLVGVPEYQMTAALWVRGLLADEYAVKPSDIRWRSGGLRMAGRREMLKLDLPKEIELQQIPNDRTLLDQFDAGELDALVSPHIPPSFAAGDPNVARMFPDYRAAERAYFRKTGLFPIMHLVVVRQKLVDENPWLPSSLFKAFVAAKDRAVHKLSEFGSNYATLPWLAAEVQETRELMGDDYWPYGIEPNRKTIEAMARYSYEHGLSARLMHVDELFAPGTDEQFKL